MSTTKLSGAISKLGFEAGDVGFGRIRLLGRNSPERIRALIAATTPAVRAVAGGQIVAVRAGVPVVRAAAAWVVVGNRSVRMDQ